MGGVKPLWKSPLSGRGDIVEPLPQEREERPEQTTDSSDLLDRLKGILRGRKFGLSTEHVERSYERQWGEPLPGDWRAQIVRTEVGGQFLFEEDDESQVSWVKLLTQQ